MVKLIEENNLCYTLDIYNDLYKFVPPVSLYPLNSFKKVACFIPKNKSILIFCVKDKRITINQISKAIGKNALLANKINTKEIVKDNSLPDWI